MKVGKRVQGMGGCDSTDIEFPQCLPDSPGGAGCAEPSPGPASGGWCLTAEAALGAIPAQCCVLLLLPVHTESLIQLNMTSNVTF